MTSQGVFTNSQEEAILQEVGIKDFEGQFLDQISLPFSSECYDFSTPLENYEINEKSDDKFSSSKNFQEVHTTPILGKEEFGGKFDFQLSLNFTNPGKHLVFSEKLSKVFIHMEEVLPLHFMWTPAVDGLWIRATMVYKLDQHRSQPVLRCHNHMAPDNNSNRFINKNYIKHVVRCVHPASSYHESPTGHLFVLTPLGVPAAGISNVPMDFKFFCKNSCTSGMNRRPTEILFTLETENNEVLGRRKLEIRVCSCPKRDKEKEEKELLFSQSIIGQRKKRKLSSYTDFPNEKKNDDDKVYSLNLQIIGKDNYNSVLKFAYDAMAGAAMRTGNFELYKPYMEKTIRLSLN